MQTDDENPAVRELRAGAAFWRTTNWPRDFHNSDYERWFQENPKGDFTTEWWNRFLKKQLHPWIATRGDTHAAITARFLQNAAALRESWQTVCASHLAHDHDISAVTWEEIRPFPDLVAKLKPTRNPSLVFTSKFCHFLLPKIFPVGDNLVLGVGQWPYERYFRHVQRERVSNGVVTQTELVAELTRLIEDRGSRVYSRFPMINKIAELRIIGRRHGSR